MWGELCAFVGLYVLPWYEFLESVVIHEVFLLGLELLIVLTRDEDF
jgi:hypothetical protein